MRATFRSTFPILAVLAASAVWSSAGAQAPPHACSLTSKAEIEKLLGRTVYSGPDSMSLAGGAGTLCSFDGDAAQVILYSGPKSGELLDGLVKGFGHEDEKKHPAPAVGEGAYIFYPKPKNQYQATVGFLVVKPGPYALGISMAAEEGEPAESVQPALVTFSKNVLAKLK